MKKSFNYLFAIVCFALLLSFQIESQELNENYLKSLPPDIQADVLKNIAQQVDTRAELYRGPKTTVLQLDSALQQIKLQLMEIENELLDDDSNDIQLQRFGSKFFRSFQSSFSPLSLPNVTEDYIVDVGDIFDVTLVGQINEIIQELPVAKDGSLTIANLGKFQVAGLKLSQVFELVTKSVQTKIIGQEALVSLTSLRDINILIVGNVEFPGMYTINGNSNILSALDMVGGPTDNGSFRSIFLKRNNKVIQEFDLYDVFINGNIDFGLSLKAGDVILVNPKGKEVAVSGGVATPAYYELKDRESLKDAILYAGLSENAKLEEVTVERRLDDTTRVFKIAYKDSHTLEARNSDNIMIDFIDIRNKPIKSVEIRGEVLNPGIYAVTSEDTIHSIITKAGGYSSNAYPFGAKLTRESSKNVESQINDKIYRDLITYMANAARGVGNASQRNVLPFLLSEFQSVEPNGRVTAEFNLNVLKNDKNKDLYLQHGDLIEVPQYSPEVFA